jgi:DNA repair exonuclease SbcCD nuclease subunit
MPLTFLHTADWQLGKAFSRIADESKRTRLQQERIDCLHRIAAAVKEHQAAFVIVAGDLFDTASPTKSTVSAACSAIGTMGVPVYAIPGNHDHGGPGSLWEQEFFLRESRQLAPNLQLLLEAAPLVTEHAVLLPAPLLRRHEPGDPAAWIRSAGTGAGEGGGMPADLPRIVIAHGSIQGFSSAQDEEDSPGSAANRIELDRLPLAELDYIALGDWHGMKEVGPKAWYAGTPEPDRFPKGGSNEPGHVLKVTVSRGGSPSVETLPTARFGWHHLAFTFADDSGLNRLAEQLDALTGTRAGADLLHLELDGFLGIAAAARLEQMLESWDARLLRVKLKNRTRVTPSADELAALVDRPDDPLVARVARQLVDQAAGEGEDAEIARVALRELHAASEEKR